MREDSFVYIADLDLHLFYWIAGQADC